MASFTKLVIAIVIVLRIVFLTQTNCACVSVGAQWEWAAAAGAQDQPGRLRHLPRHVGHHAQMLLRPAPGAGRRGPLPRPQRVHPRLSRPQLRHHRQLDAPRAQIQPAEQRDGWRRARHHQLRQCRLRAQ